ncbi:MAG: EscU/YscU/HrcU family type III secretion system export apparatus switch protein [Candidatus Coatesbacteria bacterium]|nr:EscU/YscU/HrcU family type III secretion system export apparatus switch protein [Candidatus Coatesbacteria bacterium]
MLKKSDKKKAAALAHDLTRPDPPGVLAKGAGHLAERIIKLAKEHDIPIKEDADLVEALMQLDLHEAIPPELYKAVAEILAFIYSMNQKWKELKL